MAHLIITRATTAATIILVVLGIGASLAFIYLPHATVTVTPARFEKPTEQEIILSTTATEPDFVRFILPARIVEATVAESQIIERAGGTATDDFARGVVLFHNELAQEQPLLPLTHLRHESTGVFFLTDQAVRLPPLGTLSVGVTAKEAGAKSNVAAGRFVVDKLPANLQTAVYAESTTTFTGGQVFEQPLDESELNRARESVYDQAASRLAGELTAAAGGAAIRPDLTVIETEESVLTTLPGSYATSFSAQVSLRGRAFASDDNDLLSLAVLGLRGHSEPNEDFVSYNPNSFAVELLRADFDRGEARVRATVIGNYARQTESGIFDVSNLAGRSATEVAEYYRQFASVQDVAVTFAPFWVTRVPTRGSATDIVVKSQSSLINE